MSTHKIKTGGEIPSQEYIHQNKPQFNQIVKGFKGFNMNIIQKTWLVGGTAGIVAVASLLTYFLVIRPSEPTIPQENLTNTSTTDTSYFHSPFPEHDVAYETFVYDGTKDATYKTTRGTVIRIPAAAFTFMDGAEPKGPVQISFREFHNVMDIFRSGAPMEYDTAGEHRTFESAGMFEINAQQNGRPLKLAEKKKIDVDLVTYNDDPKFNLYYLDTNARNWEYISTSGFDPRNSTTEERDDVGTEEVADVDATPSVDQIKPVRAGASKFIFKVDYNKNEFPELKAFSNVLFEVDEQKSKFSAALYDVNWKDITLKRSRLKDYYLLHLVRPDTSIKVYVKPVFAAKDYQKAIDIYNGKQQQINNRNEQLHQRSERVAEQREVLESQAPASYYVSTTNSSPVAGFRNVSVFQLGTFNCDYPLPIKDYTFTPTFTLNGEVILPRKVYLSDITVNAVYTADANGEFRCNRKLQMVLWVITNDNKMAVFSVDEFKRITKGTDHPVFPLQLLSASSGMTVLERALRGENDIQMEEESPAQEESAYTKEAPPQLTLSVYPNPAKDYIRIDISGSDEYHPQLRFFNAAGTLVLETAAAVVGEGTSIDISGWSRGIYYCQIEIPGSSAQTLKFVKN